ncbi:MAG: hypothetical protein E7Z93_03025 [Cyanobacteria bacterium SIG32]|nr:hypothetical protein [Cyanobacteria bacterium SIG32]
MIIKKKKQQTEEVIAEELPVQEERVEEDNAVDLFNLDNIDFKQRNERRRGDRRRGFRRIDDRNLISRAREEAEAIREAAAKEGYQEGISAANSDIEMLRNSISQFANAKQAVFDKIAPEILSISVDIAKKIIKKELSQTPEILLDSVLIILKGLSKEETKILIRTNPSQVGMLKNEVPEMATQIGLDAKIVIIPDEAIMEGGCVVTTTNGVVDATIETQLTIISEALREI